jgi:type IV secretory pathway TrbF-like protein
VAGGHRVDTEQLTQAARTLSEVPRQVLEQPLAAVQDIQLVGADFGMAHQGRFEAYSAGVRRLAACAESYLRASEEFAQKLNASGGRYQANEADTSRAVGRHG